MNQSPLSRILIVKKIEVSGRLDWLRRSKHKGSFENVYVIFLLSVPLWLKNDKGHEADTESGDDDSSDPEIPWDERWPCRNCFQKNHPMTRRCMKCWTLNSFGHVKR